MQVYKVWKSDKKIVQEKIDCNEVLYFDFFLDEDRKVSIKVVDGELSIYLDKMVIKPHANGLIHLL